MVDEPHECEWEERLQDWIDGDLDPTEVAAVAQHSASCAICRERLTMLRALDAQLSRSVTREALDASFDCRVLDRVTVITQADRAAARARLETERREQMAALARGWRKLWRSIILNAVGWISLFIALTASVRFLPDQVALYDRVASFMHQPVASMVVAVAVAAMSTLVALLILRALSVAEGG